MSEIRELAIRLLKEVDEHEYEALTNRNIYALLDEYDIESLVRAAMREGMMRAAIHVDVPWSRMGTEFADAIRAEADKLSK